MSPEDGALLNQVAQCLVIQSCLTLCDPWTVARQAPLSMGFVRLVYWRGLPFPPSGDLSEPGIETASPEPLPLAGKFITSEPSLYSGN